MTSTRSVSSTQSASASRYRSTSGGAGQRHLRRRRAAASAACADRATRCRAHRACRHQPFDLVEHRVEQTRQLVDRVVVLPDQRSRARRCARSRMMRRPPRSVAGSAAAPTAWPASRRSARRRRSTASRGRAPREPRRADRRAPRCSSRPAPACRRAAAARPSRAATDPSLPGMLSTSASAPRSTTRTNSRSGAVRCSALNGVAQRAQPAAAVRDGVLAELRLDDLLVALRQRGRRQPVGEEHDGDRADDEQRRVPERQPQAEVAALSQGHSRRRARCAAAWASNGRSILSRSRLTSTSTMLVCGSKL